MFLYVRRVSRPQLVFRRDLGLKWMADEHRSRIPSIVQLGECRKAETERTPSRRVGLSPNAYRRAALRRGVLTCTQIHIYIYPVLRASYTFGIWVIMAAIWRASCLYMGSLCVYTAAHHTRSMGSQRHTISLVMTDTPRNITHNPHHHTMRGGQTHIIHTHTRPMVDCVQRVEWTVCSFPSTSSLFNGVEKIEVENAVWWSDRGKHF